LVLVAFHAIIFDLLDESIDVVRRGAVRRFAADALQEDGRITDPTFALSPQQQQQHQQRQQRSRDVRRNLTN